MSSNKSSKSKPITTSVPSFAIRFHAGGEELEELYPSEEEEKSAAEEKPSENTCTEVPETNKHESSPMRDYLNKFGKRSSSIDTGINETVTIGSQAAPSDPWRIFSEFKGKFTKTVEEKFSEIKSKNHDSENSPKFINKAEKYKIIGSKENSSISDSEEQSISECSVPKSGGLSSAAEELEPSSEDEHSLAESDKTPTENVSRDILDTSKSKKHGLRHRFKSKPFVQFNPKDAESENSIKISSLSTVHEKDNTPIDDEVESGVEVCEDFTGPRQIIEDKDQNAVTLIAPPGYVDLRKTVNRNKKPKKKYRFSVLLILLTTLLCTYLIFFISSFASGFIIGILLAACTSYLYYNFYVTTVKYTNHVYMEASTNQPKQRLDMPILEIPAAKEYQPVTKFEGWMNEYPEYYDPTSYHILKTQSVFLKLEGSVLRISHTRVKIPKRAMWDEPNHKVTFTHHRMYNLKESQILLLPYGLIHKRLWSKKYPICIILNKEYMNKDISLIKKAKEDTTDADDDKKSEKDSTTTLKENETTFENTNDTVGDFPLHDTLCSEDERDIMSESYSDILYDDEKDEVSINAEDWDTLTMDDAKDIETKIYLFARTCRDKEDWFRRLLAASQIKTDTDKLSEVTPVTPTSDMDAPSPSETSELTHTIEESVTSEPTDNEIDYMRYMGRYNQVKKKRMPLFSPNPRRSHKLLVLPKNQKSWTSFSKWKKVFGIFKTTVKSISEAYKRRSCKSLFFKHAMQLLNIPSMFIFDAIVYYRSKHKLTMGSGSHGKRFRQIKHFFRLPKFRKKKETLPATATEEEDKEKDPVSKHSCNLTWLNALLGRILYDVFKYNTVVDKLQNLIQRKLSTIKLPYFIEDIVISDLSLGNNSPIIERIDSPSIDERGLWINMDITYEGLIRMALVTKLNLMKLKEQAGKTDEPIVGSPSNTSETRSPIFHSDVEDSAESSSDEDTTWLLASSDTNQECSTPKANTGGRKLLRMVDKIAASKYFQQATENKYIKRALEGVSNTEFRLTVEIQFLEGILALNIPPPPSDRLWIGFKNNPKLQLSAHPTFGERSLNFVHVTRWIEKKLSLEFQKFLVLPNMEDFVIPIMNPKMSD